MITFQNVLRHELIGLDVLVAGAANPLHRGIRGRIIDETRNTFTIQTVQGRQHIPKLHSIFEMHLPDGTLVEIDGSALVMAPERRLSLQKRKRIP